MRCNIIFLSFWIDFVLSVFYNLYRFILSVYSDPIVYIVAYSTEANSDSWVAFAIDKLWGLKVLLDHLVDFDDDMINNTPANLLRHQNPVIDSQRAKAEEVDCVL